MRKFVLGISHDLVLEYKASMINSDMDISRFTIYSIEER